MEQDTQPEEVTADVPIDSAEDEEITEEPSLSRGNLFKIYDPGKGEEYEWYINDHTFIRGTDGSWHLIGITNYLENEPVFHNEKYFAHATADSLTQQQWVKQPLALTATVEEDIIWAPMIVEDDGTYYMFYRTGWGNAQISLALSDDL